jgi:hypothetical protein
MMTNTELQQRASDKAFAKMSMLLITIEQNIQDIRTGNYGGVTLDEMELVLKCNKVELKVWRYITELIEKSNKNG